VRVRVHQVGVCGTDLSLVAGKLPFARFPIVPGHELAGEIAEVGPGSRLTPGARVTANPLQHCGHCPACLAGDLHYCPEVAVLGVVRRDGAFAEEVILDDAMVRALPDALSYEEGAMVEPVVIAERTVARAQIKTGEAVAVLGAGNIGLLLIQVARLAGAGKVLVSDVLDYRLDLARRLGAEQTVNVNQRDLVEAGGEAGGFEVVIDGVGDQQSIGQSIQMCKPGGRVVVYGVPPQGELALPVLEAFRKDLSIHVSRLYPRSFDAGFALLQSGRLDLGPVITTRVPLAAAPAAIRDLSEKRGEMIKILIDPQGGET
jgi:2-desacetyl-2-hydroxyethyl bacteriochlorophyllide A dehydrogenase